MVQAERHSKKEIEREGTQRSSDSQPSQLKTGCYRRCRIAGVRVGLRGFGVGLRGFGLGFTVLGLGFAKPPGGEPRNRQTEPVPKVFNSMYNPF